MWIATRVQVDRGGALPEYASDAREAAAHAGAPDKPGRQEPAVSGVAPLGRTGGAGLGFSDDLPTARKYLFTQGHVARVAVTHKREFRKLVVQLGKELCVILGSATKCMRRRGTGVPSAMQN